MAEINIKTCKSWETLSNFIDDTFTHFNRFSFRGHADSEWLLESTLTRALKKINANIDKDQLVNEHIKNFKQNLRGRGTHNLNDIPENELLAIGQHFGLFTPLLDFSKSPYVALFFAMQGNSQSGKRCLWAISEAILEEIIESKNTLSNKIEIVNPMTNDNPRLVSQQGLFLKLPTETSFEEIILKTKTTNKGIAVFRIEFDDEIKNESLAALNNMNINNLTLFPDLIGSSLHSNYLLNIEEYLEKMRGKRWDDYEKSN